MSSLQKNLSNYKSSNVPDGEGLKFAIIVSEWNSEITENLYKGTRVTLLKHNVQESDIFRYDAPGSFELVYCAQYAQSKEFNVVIVIGSIIKGETKHFDFISNCVANGIKDLNIHLDVPVIFGVLTDDNKQQAIDRSGGKYGNKGVEAAITAIKMVNLGK